MLLKTIKRISCHHTRCDNSHILDDSPAPSGGFSSPEIARFDHSTPELYVVVTALLQQEKISMISGLV